MTVRAWRPGDELSEAAVAALIAQFRRGDIPDSKAVVYLRSALREADRLGAVDAARQILPMLAIACQVTGALAETIRLHRRRVRIEPGADALSLFIVTLAFKGFFRAALRTERRAHALGLSDGARETAFLAALDLAQEEVGSELSIHYVATRGRPHVPGPCGPTVVLEDRGEQHRDVNPYATSWVGEGNDLLNPRRWRVDVRFVGEDGRRFLGVVRRIARSIDGIVFDPKNNVLHVSASRFFVPKSQA